MPLAMHHPSPPPGSRAVPLLWAGSTDKAGIKVLPRSLAGTPLPYFVGSAIGSPELAQGPGAQAREEGRKRAFPCLQAKGCCLFLSGLVETSP